MTQDLPMDAILQRPSEGHDSPAPAAGRILRLLSGPLAGRAFPLDGRARVSIGYGLRHDVVLRGERSGQCSAVLEFDGPQTSLAVLEGSAEILGRPLAAGERVQLPAYLPFRLGDHVLAYGVPGAARWDEAQPALPPLHAEPAPPPRLVDRIVGSAARRLERIDAQTMRAGLAALCIGLITIAAAGPVGSWIADPAAEPARLRHAIRQGGFPAVDVVRASDGTLSATGVVADEAELVRLRALVFEQDSTAIVDAQTAAALAAAAADLLRAKGIPAHVRPGRPGELLIEAGYLPGDQQRRLRAELGAELPSVRRVGFRVDPDLDAGPLQAFFARSGAGLASIVSNPPHIVTADGSRWFPGATLPSGHHLLAVSAGAVVFEKDGRTEQIIP
jgi:hypothetical protein